MKGMEKYAAKRNKAIKAKKLEDAPVQARPMHEPKYDLDTLTRAEEIKRDKLRHRAAKVEAKRQVKHLANIVSPSKVKES